MDPTAPPPTYEEVLEMDRKNHEEYVADCLCAIIARVLGLVLAAAFPISCIVVGTNNLDSCPRHRQLPVVLVAIGFVSLLEVLVRFFLVTRRRLLQILDAYHKRTAARRRGKVLAIELPLVLVLIVCNIIGAVYVYPISSEGTVDDVGVECPHTLHTFAFWTITLYLLVCGMALLIAVALLLNACCAPEERPHRARQAVGLTGC